MLFNHKANLQDAQRKYLSQILHPTKLMSYLEKMNAHIEAIPAYNLVPSWIKTFSSPVAPQSLPTQLSIGLFEHQALLGCANAIAEKLNQLGVNCSIKAYSFEEFHEKANKSKLEEDLILTSLNLDDNRPSSALRWLLSNQVLHQSLATENSEC